MVPWSVGIGETGNRRHGDQAASCELPAASWSRFKGLKRHNELRLGGNDECAVHFDRDAPLKKLNRNDESTLVGFLPDEDAFGIC